MCRFRDKRKHAQAGSSTRQKLRRLFAYSGTSASMRKQAGISTRQTLRRILLIANQPIVSQLLHFDCTFPDLELCSPLVLWIRVEILRVYFSDGLKFRTLDPLTASYLICSSAVALRKGSGRQGYVFRGQFSSGHLCGSIC